MSILQQAKFTAAEHVAGQDIVSNITGRKSNTNII
jgi:hypothetical protein